MTIEQLESKGIDPILLMKRTNLTALLTDVIDVLSIEIENDLKKASLYIHEQKKDIKKLKKLTSNMVHSIDRTINNNESCNDFSEDSEYLLEVLMLLTEKKNHVQVLSTLKIIK